MEVFLELLIVLLLARLFSEGAERLEQPAAVGELMAGMVLAAAAGFYGHAFPFLAKIPESNILELVAHLGIFFLVLLAGIESKIEELQQHSRSAVGVALEERRFHWRAA